METYILKKSTNKGKRFVIIMDNMKHHFGSDVGKTFIDNRTEKEKQAWMKRHQVNKNWNNKHSSIFFSRHLLWNTKNLKKNIKLLEKLLNVKIKVEI